MTVEERARAVAVLEKEFGPQWQTIVQMLGTENLRRRVGKELTSFIAYPDRETAAAMPGAVTVVPRL